MLAQIFEYIEVSCWWRGHLSRSLSTVGGGGSAAAALGGAGSRPLFEGSLGALGSRLSPPLPPPSLRGCLHADTSKSGSL